MAGRIKHKQRSCYSYRTHIPYQHFAVRAYTAETIKNTRLNIIQRIANMLGMNKGGK